MTQWLLPLLAMVAYGGPVEDALRTAITQCHQQFINNEVPPETWVMDPRNGYAEVGGVFPTCGCTCTATAAAFRTAAQEYRVLSTHTASCDVAAGVTGDDWSTVLPHDLREVLLPGVSADNTQGVFVLFAQLPRSGTTTTLMLRPIPLGAAPAMPWWPVPIHQYGAGHDLR